MQENATHYELTLIINATASENEHPAILAEVKNLLEKNSAQNIRVLDLGRKKLAYAIKNLKHGFYFSYEFDLIPASLTAIDNALKLNKNVLRHLVIKKKVKTAAEIARQEKIKSGKIREEVVKKEAEKEEIRQAQPVKTAKPKISLEDLDKKLDELLDEKVI
ncbi:MAG: 30S ribosomal protein S6 [Patescibacteria group bacterium]|jgi:small subunit ribosomal protein S6